jgi:hypothetical protein
METRTEGQLTALIMHRVRQHRECDHVMSVAISPPLQKNWDVEWTADGPDWTPLRQLNVSDHVKKDFEFCRTTTKNDDYCRALYLNANVPVRQCMKDAGYTSSTDSIFFLITCVSYCFNHV